MITQAQRTGLVLFLLGALFNVYGLSGIYILVKLLLIIIGGYLFIKNG